MRILVVQPTGDKMGHYGIYTVRLCQALGRRGHVVTLCTNRIYPERYVCEPLAFSIQQVDSGKWRFEQCDHAMTSFPAYYWWGYFRNSYRITSAAFKLCRSKDFDVVYITDAEFLVASVLLKLYGVRIPPVVMEVSAANFSFRDYPGSLPKKLYKVLQREIFKTIVGRQMQAISTLGEWHKPRLISQLRLPLDFTIAVIPDGGDEPSAVLSKVEARQKLGIDFTGPIFLFFGMLRKDKGIEILFEAAARLRSQEFKLMIAGHPIEYTSSAIDALVNKAGLEDKVILKLGYIEDGAVPLYFFAADALVLPYARIYTGGSGPLMKGACTYGRPVIASDVSELGRLVKQHELGLVSEPEDSESLASRLTEFLELPEETKQEMGKRASVLARANSWEAMAERFTKLFEEILQKRNR